MAMADKEINVSEIIKRRKYNLAVRQGYRNLLMRIIFFGLVGYFLFTQVFLLMRNTGMNMFPSMKDGDLILAYRLEKDYQKNDVVIYTINGEMMTGRIVARENDVVTLDDSGILRVNGTMQDGEIVFPTYAKESITYPYTVPEGNFFILGDHRTQAKDSRDFGPVNQENIKGKLLTLLRRRGL